MSMPEFGLSFVGRVLEKRAQPRRNHYFRVTGDAAAPVVHGLSVLPLIPKDPPRLGPLNVERAMANAALGSFLHVSPLSTRYSPTNVTCFRSIGRMPLMGASKEKTRPEPG
jgi:hypothetical protein